MKGNSTSLLNTNNTMNHMKSLSMVLCAIALAAGCSKQETSSQPPDKATTETAAKQLDELKADTKEVAQDLKDYTYAQKAEFVESMQARLTALNKELDLLSAKIDRASDKLKAQAEPKVRALRNQVTQLKQQLDAVTDANESTWDSVQAKAQKAYADLKDGFRQAQQWVSDKLSS
jgi:archaellum component FlaC